MKKWSLECVSINYKTNKVRKDYYEFERIEEVARCMITFKPIRGYTVTDFKVNLIFVLM